MNNKKLSKEERRQARPDVAAFADNIREHFGAVPHMKVTGVGPDIEWGERRVPEGPSYPAIYL